MKAFRFRLARVLDLRRKQLEREEARLEQHIQQVKEVETRIAQLEGEQQSAARLLTEQTSFDGSELAALAAYRQRLRTQAAQLGTELQNRRKLLADQQKLYSEAKRKVRLLERLKERQHQEWEEASQKELEEIQADSFLARWHREAQRTRLLSVARSE